MSILSKSQTFEASDLTFLRSVQSDESLVAGSKGLFDFLKTPYGDETYYSFENEINSNFSNFNSSSLTLESEMLLVSYNSVGNYGVFLQTEAFEEGDEFTISLELNKFEGSVNLVQVGLRGGGAGWASVSQPVINSVGTYEIKVVAARDAASGFGILVYVPFSDGSIRIKNISWKRKSKTIQINEAVKNLVYEKDNAVAILQEFDDIVNKKGLEFSDSDTASRRFDLPLDGFDLNKIGNYQSCFVSIWLTPDATPNTTGAFNGVAGFAFQTGSENQWSLDSGPSGSDGNNYRFLINAIGHFIGKIDLGKPNLLSFFIVKTSNTEFSVYVYWNKRLIVTTTSNSFPFNKPITVSTARLGGLFAEDWKGVVHRIQSAVFNESTFSIDEWLEKEFDENYDRFVV